MKILFISLNYDLNGATRMLQSAAEYWVSHRKFSIYALVLDKEYNSSTDIWQSIGVDVIFDPIDFKNYDLILVNGILSIDLIRYIKNTAPTILWIHEGSTILYNTKLQIREYINFFESYSKIIFQSSYQNDFIFKSFTHTINNSNIHYIPSFILPIADEISPISIRKESYTVICIGSVCVRKGQMLLANAIKSLSKKYELKCIFIGDTKDAPPDWLTQIEFDRSSNSPVHWMGKITDRIEIHSLLMSSNLACLASNDESDPIFPLEAAVLGVPSLLNDLPIYDYIGWKHLNNCFKFDLSTPELIEQSVEYCIINQDTVRQIGLNAKDYVLAHRTIDQFHNALDNIILDL